MFEQIPTTVFADILVTLGAWCSFLWALFVWLLKSGSPVFGGYGQKSWEASDFVIPVILMIPGLGFILTNWESIDFMRLAMMSLATAIVLPACIFYIFFFVLKKIYQ